MKTIALKNGMVIFAEQIAFIHIQPSASADGMIAPEVHVHFSAALNGPKGSRSMRAVVGDDCSQDFLDQLEKQDVNCAHMRRRISELKKPAA